MKRKSAKAESVAEPEEARCLCSGFGPSLSKMVEALAPKGAANEDFRRARVEMLKGIREVLNHRIEELSKGPEARGTRVTVE